MSRKSAQKWPEPSQSPDPTELTRTQDVAGRLSSVPRAPGEHPDHASAIPLVVHDRFAPRDGFETVLVEEIADLTRRIRTDERRMEQIQRIRRNDLVESALTRSLTAKGATAETHEQTVGAVLAALSSGSGEDYQNASDTLARHGIDLVQLDAQAWVACAGYIEQLNRQIAGCRRQREHVMADLERLRRAAARDGIADAEEVPG
jgi:hypothetical protein